MRWLFGKTADFEVRHFVLRFIRVIMPPRTCIRNLGGPPFFENFTKRCLVQNTQRNEEMIHNFEKSVSLSLLRELFFF